MHKFYHKVIAKQVQVLRSSSHRSLVCHHLNKHFLLANQEKSYYLSSKEEKIVKESQEFKRQKSQFQWQQELEYPNSWYLIWKINRHQGWSHSNEGLNRNLDFQGKAQL